jgi:hypothetical protein
MAADLRFNQRMRLKVYIFILFYSELCELLRGEIHRLLRYPSLEMGLSAWIILGAFVVGAAAHGSMINPIPRNAVDRNLSMFIDGAWPNGDDGCNCANPKGGCVPAAARPGE